MSLLLYKILIYSDINLLRKMLIVEK